MKPKGALRGCCAALLPSQPPGRQSPVAHPLAARGGCRWRDREKRNKEWETAKDYEKKTIPQKLCILFSHLCQRAVLLQGHLFSFPHISTMHCCFSTAANTVRGITYPWAFHIKLSVVWAWTCQSWSKLCFLFQTWVRRDLSPCDNRLGLTRAATTATLLENHADMTGSVHFEEAYVFLLRQVRMVCVSLVHGECPFQMACLSFHEQ